MPLTTQRQPGTLIHYRERDWLVLPSDDPDLLYIRPLGGSDEESTAVYLPLEIPSEKIVTARFPEPKATDIGSFQTARLLFDAFRLSFRNACGPFRCIGKLSFRPRAYQLVPLVMALKLDIPRLLIADDVGIGKTVEALVILKELMERGDIKRFAVICPPHLCEQWQQELQDKLDIEADIIRSSTASLLDRRLPDDRSVFHHLPFQIVSIDYAKADKRRGIFINDCPEFIIVDEAHTCALPAGAKSKAQQQRYALLHDLAADKNRQILLLTATPHSGKDSEFASLLSLLNPQIGSLNFESLERKDRERIARHFLQRKREQIRHWLSEDTIFPNRDSKEIGFHLSPEYHSFYRDLRQFARGISAEEKATGQTKLLRSWAAISLIKGCMSSPAMALEMLQRRKEKLANEPLELEKLLVNIADEQLDSPLFENLEVIEDMPKQDLLGTIKLSLSEGSALDDLYVYAEKLIQVRSDNKLEAAIRLVQQWLQQGFDCIVFCHYIPTANYVAEKLRAVLSKNVHVEAVTSELVDEQRKERIEIMTKGDRRVLVATDCLSEGINLQEHFTAVLHYDLPWNPNRLEQREGRVDRFGQSAPVVKTYLLYGENNEMDQFIMEVLIRKVREIQRSTGVSITIGENSKSIMNEAAQRLLQGDRRKEGTQQELFQDVEESISNDLEQARKRGENIRNIFAHATIDPEAIKADLMQVDEAIGDVSSLEHFVNGAVQLLGGVCRPDGKQGYLLQLDNLPPHIRACFTAPGPVKVSFASPTPKGYNYVGRNHKFTELLCQFLVGLSFEPKSQFGKIARVSEIQSSNVNTKTVLVMFRIRNVIKEVRSLRESIAEEMYLWGYQSSGENIATLDYSAAKALLMVAESLGNLSSERQQHDIAEELQRFQTLKTEFMKLANYRADQLVAAHGRFKELVGGRRYEKATPVLPPDVMGVYILLPKPKDL